MSIWEIVSLCQQQGICGSCQLECRLGKSERSDERGLESEKDMLL